MVRFVVASVILSLLPEKLATFALPSDRERIDNLSGHLARLDLFRSCWPDEDCLGTIANRADGAFGSLPPAIAVKNAASVLHVADPTAVRALDDHASPF